MARSTPFPHDLVAERALLGAILLGGRPVLDAVRDLIRPDDWYRDAHRAIYRAMLSLEADHPVDLVTITAVLRARGALDQVGGPAYLSGLIDGVPSAFHADGYAAVVRGHARRRALAARLEAARQAVLDPAVPLDEDWRAGLDAGIRAAVADLVGEARLQSEEAEAIRQRGAGYRRRPLVESWLASGEITLLHGQPRDGKTWLALELALAVSGGRPACGVLEPAQEGPVLLVGNEDRAEVLVHRLSQLTLGATGRDQIPLGLRLLVHRGISLDDPAGAAAVFAETQRLGARLVVLDPLRSLTDAVDKGPADLRPFALWARQLVAETGVSLLCLHHDSLPPKLGSDLRRRSHRVSGGGLFALADSPLGTERLSAAETLVVADGFKHTADPPPAIFRREAQPSGGLRLQLLPATGETAEAVALDAELLRLLGAKGGLGVRDLLRATQRRYAVIKERLDALIRAGRVDTVLGPRRRQIYFLTQTDLPPASPPHP